MPGRLVILDVIRGVAVMGIFSVNIVAMAMIEAAYFYPPAYGFENLIDRIMWAANFLLVDGKMRSLFSILFGASLLLVLDRAAQSGRSPASAHLRRMAVLFAIGLIHFYLFWWGDILTLYAMVGLMAFALSPLPVPALLAIAAALYAYAFLPGLSGVTENFAAEAAARAPGAPAEAISQWQNRSAFFIATPAEVSGEKAMHASPLAHARFILATRSTEPLQVLTFLWQETLALMLIGMAGLRSGFLTGGWSNVAYRRIAIAGIGVGIAAFAILAEWVMRSSFSIPSVAAANLSLSIPFRPVMAIGYAALIVLLARGAGLWRDRFAAVGRMALSNYLGCTLLGTMLFFDTGLGLFGRLSRAECWLAVPVAWALMLLWSKPWLDRFQYGPLEWVWRSLSRGRLQPMRKTA